MNLKHTGLGPAPDAAVNAGAPASGRYQGRIARIDWRGLSGPYSRSALWRHLHHKRWHYVGLGNAELFIGVAIVHLGWTATAFAYVFERRSKTLLANWRQDGLPGLQCGVSERPLTGCDSWFRGPGARLSLKHQAGKDTLSLNVRTATINLQAELSLRDAAPMLLAIGPIGPGGVAHATQKTPALRVSGTLNVNGQRYELGQALASVDASNGLLARNTDWRWACAHGFDVGFNLQSGYFGAHENALWLHGDLIPLGAARFEFDPQRPLAPWRVSTDDGLLDLSFQPEGARQEDRNLIIAASHYIQPIGRFSGSVRAASDAPAVAVSGLLGVTEDHRSRW